MLFLSPIRGNIWTGEGLVQGHGGCDLQSVCGAQVQS